MKHFSLFSGYGGFDIACQRNNIETVGFSEIDKYASAVLKYHWPNIKNYGDITKINWSEVPDFDLLTGGSPCQDLSIAGKRAGLEGARSGLFYEYMRAVREKKPKYFIWENVKGAMSSNQGRDFAYVLNEMAEAGYSLWWQVLNAKDFGVPQNRERIFVVGFRDGSPREVFFDRNSNELNIQSKQELQEQSSNCLRTNYSSGYSNETYVSTDKSDTQERGYKSDNSNSIRRTPYSNGMRIRRLTPVECERLMGLPDGWTKYGIQELNGGNKFYGGMENRFEISDSQRYKLCGNGVVVNVVEEIIKNIILCSKNS